MTPRAFPDEKQDPQQRLWEIEAKIVDVFVEFGKYRNRSPRDSAVYTFFYIHKTLTQTQLRGLAEKYLNVRKLRGFSTGSISTLLNDMGKKKVIAKRRDEITNSFQYQILGSMKQLNLAQLGILLFYQSSLEELKRRIKEELVGVELDSPDYQNFEIFLNELTNLIDLYKKIQQDFASETSVPSIPPQILTKNVLDFFKTLPDPAPTQEEIAKRHGAVPPTVLRIENLIVNYFITRDKQTGTRGEVTSKVLSQFLIHRDLTQEKLRQLTGLSMGAVSQAVRNLLDQEIIRTKSEGDRSIHYQLQGLVNAFQTFTHLLIDRIDEWGKQLEMMLEELETQEAKFQDISNYENVREFLRDLIDFFQLSRRFAQHWKNLSKEA